MNLEQLLRLRQDVWRGRDSTLSPGPGTPTGYPALDAQLPGAGWPLGALVEIYPDCEGIGELRLLLPALAHLSRADRWILWIGAPHVPYAPALIRAGIRLARVLLIRPRTPGDGLWATEQALRSGACGAVLSWPSEETPKALRRLQLAAEEGGCLGVLYRSAASLSQASTAALRLRLEPGPEGLAVRILKCRGSIAGPRVVVLPADYAAWAAQTPERGGADLPPHARETETGSGDRRH